jgi:hypothetical protein
LTPKELLTFIKTSMRMSHVYQPIVIRHLVEAGGTSTVRQLARSLAATDLAQIAFYEKRVREMPLRVLRKHGVVDVDGDLVRLNVGRLDLSEALEVEVACNERIANYLKGRGEKAWSGLIDFSNVPSGLRYQVLKRDRRCRLCGVGPNESVLHVDHVIPRSRGGSNEINNLQVLCQACNLGKSNLDNTQF